MKALSLLFVFLVIVSCQSRNIISQNKAGLVAMVNSDDVVLVDVRIPEQFEKETAKNAINIPLAKLKKETAMLKGKKVVVFCNKGIQADQAYIILKKKGIEVYDGTTVQNIKAIQNIKKQ